jgi:dihydrolipoamide dehydrogenase
MVEDALRVLTSEEGLQIVLGADVQLESEGDAVRARWRTGGQEHEIRAERVLVAVGRPPAVDRLGLAEIGVEMRDGGPVCRPATRQCGDLPIFVAGDAAGEEPLLHLAVRDGALAGRNAATFPTVSPEPRPVRLRIAFTDPQMAIVGRSQEDFPEGEIIVGESSFEDQGRAVILGRNAGRIRVFAHCGRGTLEGAELFGPDFEHLAHLLAWAVQSGASVKDLLQMPFYHPTLEEGLRTALRDAARNAGWLPAKKSSDRNREHLSVAG